VLDADALNLIAANPALHKIVAQRTAGTVMTPHPLEAARLLHISSAEIQADRVAAARRLAHTYHATIVLKGSGSIIADLQNHIAINPTGNPGLATAGTGDVLTGIIGALLAQGWSESDAAIGAVWLHGNAADELVGLHGKEKIAQWHQHALSGNMEPLVAELLTEHYDPAYKRSIQRNFNQYDQAQLLELTGIDMESLESAARQLSASL